MATIKDVARLAGVSVATVSRVINNSPKASEASRLAVHSAMAVSYTHLRRALGYTIAFKDAQAKFILPKLFGTFL